MAQTFRARYFDCLDRASPYPKYEFSRYRYWRYRSGALATSHAPQRIARFRVWPNTAPRRQPDDLPWPEHVCHEYVGLPERTGIGRHFPKRHSQHRLALPTARDVDRCAVFDPGHASPAHTLVANHCACYGCAVVVGGSRTDSTTIRL